MKQSVVDFKVLNYEYLNTGGNTMVGVFTVWLPAELKTVYALTNEEGCNLAVVDYINNYIEVDDYDDLIIDHCVFDFLDGSEECFELYRYCLNEYTKSDCRHFGVTRNIPYKLLSDELKAKIDPDYLAWLNYRNYNIETDGEIIVIHPDYEVLQDDEELRHIKHWRRWHNDLINRDTTDEELESFYDKKYRLTFNGKRVYLPFNADTFNKINDLLDSVIQEW